MYSDKKYLLVYLVYGDEEVLYSDDLDKLKRESKDMILKNDAKPLIIENKDGKVVREFTPKRFNLDVDNYSEDAKRYEETMKEIGMEEYING